MSRFSDGDAEGTGKKLLQFNGDEVQAVACVPRYKAMYGM